MTYQLALGVRPVGRRVLLLRTEEHFDLAGLAGHVNLQPLAGVGHVQLGLWRRLDGHHGLVFKARYISQVLENISTSSTYLRKYI